MSSGEPGVVEPPPRDGHEVATCVTVCGRIVRKIKWKNFLTESEEEKGRIDFLTSKVDPDPENSKHSFLYV